MKPGCRLTEDPGPYPRFFALVTRALTLALEVIRARRALRYITVGRFRQQRRPGKPWCGDIRDPVRRTIPMLSGAVSHPRYQPSPTIDIRLGR
jgi:hypothetical protein